jgi:putative transposase
MPPSLLGGGRRIRAQEQVLIEWGMCALRRSKHSVYDLKYHYVWIPKYGKKILTAEVADSAKQVFKRIADEYDMIIDRMEVVEDHVHIFLESPPRLSPAQIVQILESISVRELFRQYPHLRGKLWGGRLWSDGFFARAAGDEVTGDVIRRYIKYHEHGRAAVQLALWDD